MAAGAIDVAAILSKQDMAGVMSEIERRSRTLGVSLKKATMFAGWTVADSLRLATKIAPKRRTIRETDAPLTRRGNKTYEVESMSGGKKTTFKIYAKGKREANKNPRAQIKRRGLAAKVWHFGQRPLGSGRGSPRTDAKTSKRARNSMTVTVRGGQNPSVEIENRLGYASQAFKSSGEQTVNNALSRAAARMVHMTNAALVKQMGLK